PCSPHSFPPRRSSDLISVSRFLDHFAKQPGHSSVGLVDVVEYVGGASIGVEDELDVHVGLVELKDFRVIGVDLDFIWLAPEEHRSEEHTSELQSRFDL